MHSYPRRLSSSTFIGPANGDQHPQAMHPGLNPAQFQKENKPSAGAKRAQIWGESGSAREIMFGVGEGFSGKPKEPNPEFNDPDRDYGTNHGLPGTDGMAYQAGKAAVTHNPGFKSLASAMVYDMERDPRKNLN